MKPSITVVIPNYNGAQLLLKNLPAAKAALKAYREDCSIIVVDDGSTDDSLEVLKKHFPEVSVAVHNQNKGFAEAIHTGVNTAKTELLFLLNSDVQVQDDIFDSLVSYFDDENTFSVNPLIYDEQGKVKRHAWNLRQLKNGVLKLMKWSLDDALAWRGQGQKLPTMYAHGGSFMVRKSMFLALGGFNPIYKPFYGEDSDLGLRAWRRGWGSYFEPTVHIVHQSVGAIRSNVKLNYVKCIKRRNRYVLEWTHLSVPQLLFSSIPVTVFRLLGELLILDKINLKGFYLGLLKIPEIMNNRAELRKEGVASLDQLLVKMRQYC